METCTHISRYKIQYELGTLITETYTTLEQNDAEDAVGLEGLTLICKRSMRQIFPYSVQLSH